MSICLKPIEAWTAEEAPPASAILGVALQSAGCGLQLRRTVKSRAMRWLRLTTASPALAVLPTAAKRKETCTTLCALCGISIMLPTAFEKLAATF